MDCDDPSNWPDTLTQSLRNCSRIPKLARMTSWKPARWQSFKFINPRPLFQLATSNLVGIEPQKFMKESKKNQGRLPDFIVIGSGKGGTTSLDFYLSLHPEIQMARPKEPRFFVDLPPPLGRWSLGIPWYRGLFRSGKKFAGKVLCAIRHGLPWEALRKKCTASFPEPSSSTWSESLLSA